MSVLLVDDSDDPFNHVEDFSAALDSLGWAHDTYDAAGTQSVPSINDLVNYDLVIWHTGADSDSLSFWSRFDTINFDLQIYLAAGGRMWLIGTDVLFDRYGGAPIAFAPGDFPYDFLGIDSYDLQTNVDDGGLGLPVANPASGSPISGLPQLDWIFSTLWYVDGVTPTSGVGTTVYEMGDNSYLFSGHTCGVWADNGTSQVLSFFFNISQASSFQLMKDATEQVMNFFQSQVVAADPAANHLLHASLSPNPAAQSVALQVEFPTTGKGSVRVFTAYGTEVWAQDIAVKAGKQSLTFDVQAWTAGVYFVRVDVAGHSHTLKLVKQ